MPRKFIIPALFLSLAFFLPIESWGQVPSSDQLIKNQLTDDDVRANWLEEFNLTLNSF